MIVALKAQPEFSTYQTLLRGALEKMEARIKDPKLSADERDLVFHQWYGAKSLYETFDAVNAGFNRNKIKSSAS